MKEDALSRLDGIAEEYSDNSPKQVYSLEEQMDSAQENEDIFSEMSAESKESLLGHIQEVKLESEPPMPSPEEKLLTANAPVEEPVMEEPTVLSAQPDERLFNNNKKKSRAGRPKKETTENKETVAVADNSSMYNPIMDKLAKDIIDDLRKNKYSINGFNNQLMQIVLNYMQDKF
jgi:hypothetical protein